MGGGGGGEVSAGGESDDADFIWIDVPFLGACADGADGALGVGDGGGVVVVGGVSVAEDEGGDAVVVAPLGDLFSFVVHGEVAVATAGGDDDGGAVGFVLGGEPGGDLGGIFVGGAECAGGAVSP